MNPDTALTNLLEALRSEDSEGVAVYSAELQECAQSNKWPELASVWDDDECYSVYGKHLPPY